jgi:hypothetical protein
MSESADEDISIVLSLECILKDLRDAQARVTKLIASERRARREDEDVTTTLRKIRRKLSSVNEGLGAVAEPVAREAKHEKKTRQRAIGDDEDDANNSGNDVGGEGGDHSEEEVEVVQEPKKRAAPAMRVAHPFVVVARAKAIGDGMAGRLDDLLIYFALIHERNKKLWISPSRNRDALVSSHSVERNQLQQVEFDSLVGDERAWYLSQLELDILRRFGINFPLLFSRSGCDMIAARASLIETPNVCVTMMESFARHMETMRLSSKTSPALSATNNTALMIVATLHRELSATDDADWYGKFEEQVRSMCDRCALTFSTMKRYRNVGELMLRCNVLACLLPSFIALLEGPIAVLLNNKETIARFEDAFQEQLIDYTKSLDLGGLEQMQVVDKFGSGLERADEGDYVVEKQDHLNADDMAKYNGVNGEKGNDFSGKGNSDDFLAERGIMNGNGHGDSGVGESGGTLITDIRDVVGDGKEKEELNSYAENHQKQVDYIANIPLLVKNDKEKHNVVAKHVQKLRLCRKCKSMIASYTCDTNSHNFCWKCDGYDNAPPDELFYPNTDVSIHTYIFCEKHLNGIESCEYAYEHYLKTPNLENALTLANFVSYVQAEEARQVVSNFSRKDCMFSITPIEPNGWCIFESIAVCVGDSLEHFILALQRFVDEYVSGKGEFMNEVAQFVYLWKNLDPNNNDTVQELWACEDGDLLLPMVADYLNRDSADAARIVVWKIVKGVLERQPLEYPSNEGQFEQTIDLLQTNLIVPHYDLLQRIAQ